MKKLFALLLALAMLLTLVACGGEKAEDAGSMTTNSSLNGANDDVDADTNVEADADANIEAIKAALTGTWVPINENKYEDGSNIITFNADGTIDMLGTTYTWEVTSAESAEEGHLALYDGETEFYTAEYEIKDKVLNYLCFEFVKGADNKYRLSDEYSTYAPEYYKESDFKIIEINSDNFADYFELGTFTKVTKDSFGDAEKIEIYYGYVLKEEYGTVKQTISSSAFEYTCALNQYTATADKTTAAYEKGSLEKEWPASTEMDEGETQPNLDENYGVIVKYTRIDKFPTDTIDYPDNFEVLRATGTIYTYTPAE